MVERVYLAERSDGGLCGFLEASFRSRADGCESTPVGYIEGWYVDWDMRRQSVGRDTGRGGGSVGTIQRLPSDGVGCRLLEYHQPRGPTWRSAISRQTGSCSSRGSGFEGEEPASLGHSSAASEEPVPSCVSPTATSRLTRQVRSSERVGNSEKTPWVVVRSRRFDAQLSQGPEQTKGRVPGDEGAQVERQTACGRSACG